MHYRGIIKSQGHGLKCLEKRQTDRQYVTGLTNKQETKNDGQTTTDGNNLYKAMIDTMESKIIICK